MRTKQTPCKCKRDTGPIGCGAIGAEPPASDFGPPARMPVASELPEFYQPLFADVLGTPTPILPVNDDGTARVPDGVIVLNLRQAVDRFRRPAHNLRRLWERTWGEVLPPADAPAVLADGATKSEPPAPAEHLERLRRLLYSHLLDDEWRSFLDLCQARRLSPWTRQLCPAIDIHADGARTLRIVTTIDVLRAIARRTGHYAGIAYQQCCGPQLEWLDAWGSDERPYAARVGVLRRGVDQPFAGVALWRDYAR